MKAAWQIWLDRRGRISPLRIATLALLAVPVAIALYDARAIAGGARPLNDLIHRAGFWALVFVLLSLGVTPLRRVARFGQLIDVRRMIGIGAFVYAMAHFILYVADQRFDVVKIASEIVSRIYLVIGFVALLGLCVLAATSTDAMVKRLGGMRWRRMHQGVYVITLLALIHYFQQTKADISVPVFAGAIFGWLMLYRLLAWWRGAGELNAWWLLALGVVTAVLTFAAEAGGIALVFGVSPLRVLETAFDFDAGIRPGWQVLAAALCVVALDLVRGWMAQPRPARSPV